MTCPAADGAERFTPVQVAEVKALACTLPAETGAPLSRWSSTELAGEVIGRGIAETISPATVRRWLAADAIKPWQHRSWTYPRDPDFAIKAARVLDLYARSWHGKPLGPGDYVISADEKSHLQALHRRHRGQLSAPGRTRRVEFEYRRGGTLAYFAAYDVHHARVLGQIAPKTGIDLFEKVVAHVMTTEPYASARRVFWVVDNGSSHNGTRSIERMHTTWPTATWCTYRSTHPGSTKSKSTSQSCNERPSTPTTSKASTNSPQVTVLEATDRVLERVIAPEVSAFFTRIHRDAGVDIRTQALVEAFTGNGNVREVVLADGALLPADVVIVGVGVVPNTELASAAGLSVDNGIVIDDQARTSDPDIVAAGDCTSHVMARYGSRIRLESVPSAGEQAKIAAATICGKRSAIAALPWFWSDQYDLKLQIAGLNTGYDEVVLSGDPSRHREFSCFYFRDGELIAADCVNRPRDFMLAKRAITKCLPTDRAELLAASETSSASGN